MLNVLPVNSSGFSCRRAHGGEVARLRGNLRHGQRVCVAQYRDDQSVGQRDRNADVHAAVLDQHVAAKRHIHFRVRAQAPTRPP